MLNLLRKLKHSPKVRALAQRAGSATIAGALQQMCNTIRVKIAHYDISVDPARPEYNEHCIFVFWHENVSVLIPSWAGSSVTILLSQHRDAEWLSQAASVLGFHVVRGSSTRGGSSAIRQLKNLSNRSSFAIAPDGPQGPRRQMALGPIFMASLLGMPIVPVGIGYENAIRLNTWDRFALPRPFAKGRIVMGPKIVIPRGIKREKLEGFRTRVERLLNDLSDFAEDWANSDRRMVGEYVLKGARRKSELVISEKAKRRDAADDTVRRAA